MNNTKVIEQTINPGTKKNIEEILDIQNIQTYFPILDHFVDDPEMLSNKTSL